MNQYSNKSNHLQVVPHMCVHREKAIHVVLPKEQQDSKSALQGKTFKTSCYIVEKFQST